MHVRLCDVGIGLTAPLIIHQSYTPLCHPLAPAHVAAAVLIQNTHYRETMRIGMS